MNKPDQLKEEIMEDEIYQILHEFIDESRGQPMNEEYEIAYKKLLSLFQSQLEAIIGEDEIIEPNMNTTSKIHLQGRNGLREEQRQKLAQTPSKDLGDKS